MSADRYAVCTIRPFTHLADAFKLEQKIAEWEIMCPATRGNLDYTPYM